MESETKSEQVAIPPQQPPKDDLNDIFTKIKTHFPPAKIKKIMQSDEDIGKVSSATPVVCGRSLEFFIALLVYKSMGVANELGVKRISPEIMKKTILEDDRFDFLRESICGQDEEGKEDEVTA
ncbi:related to Negative cofactor 2 complex subunit alpha [Saccharomycodes ludwigii]|uniref:Related to Negative cofactor 2 complex subunit alpha n=1 Tax=Saccharomycodes ludwigii TaxID=36035 RepID=A0A376BAT2_9ASCO|nr:hypothetical protein SCDLUD_001649 [Saccharomycodes ludwigii]KAH3901866.1 hypothetical protein SCDLUD_001649 [Saccharomycodes ludwigii]SSD61250.1 related to Negative cofactor 2 complex subunit alpha [Saccharomycodes ludwigii]